MDIPSNVPADFTPFVIKIDHVGVAVRDFDAAVAFYGKAFGMRLVHEETNEEQGVHEGMVAVGDSDSCIQILAPLTDDSPIGKFLARNGEGIQQMALRVTDIEKAAEVLKAAGVRVLYAEPKTGTAGSRVNFCHPKDCGGVLMELVEPAKSH